MKKIVLYGFLLGITGLILINPAETVAYALEGLNLCYEVIIPSLFPFFVCSGLLIYSGFCEVLSKLFQPVMMPLFRINGSGAAAFVLGIISGYPLGAVTACQLYENHYISQSEAERLLAFCSNSGPLFILGAIGISLYHSLKIGILLYVAHILAAIAVGILFRFYKRNSYHAPISKVTSPERNIGELYATVLANSVQSILMVCGSIIFFCIISNIAIQYLHLDGVLKAFVLGLSEFTTGITALSKTTLPLWEKLVLSAGIVGFAGLCVHIQVLSVVAKHMLSLKPYIIGKLLHGLIAAGFTAILIQLYPVTDALQVFYPVTTNTRVSAAFAVSASYTVVCVLSVLAVCVGLSVWLVLREAKALRRRIMFANKKVS